MPTSGDFDAVVLALATRLRAGMLPRQALASLNEPGAMQVAELGDAETARELVQRYPQWSPVLVLLRLNRLTGIALAPMLESLAQQLKQQRLLVGQLRTLSLAGKATMLIICGLPLVILLASEASGVGALRAVGEHGVAALAVVCGTGLLGIAGWWMRRILQQAAEIEADEGQFLEFCAAALAAGVSLERAIESISQTEQYLGLETSGRSHAEHWRSEGRTHGMPLVPLLRAAVDELRTRQREASERRLALVPIRLLLPIGIVALPGFVLVGVVPTALALLVSTGFVG